MKETTKSQQTASEVLEPPKKRRKRTQWDPAEVLEEDRWEDPLTLSRVSVELVRGISGGRLSALKLTIAGFRRCCSGIHNRFHPRWSQQLFTCHLAEFSEG